MDYQINFLIISIGTLALEMSLKHSRQGLAACLSSQDTFSLTCLPVTNFNESTVILAHQLYNFGTTGHKFSRTLKTQNGNLFEQQ